MRKEIMQDKKRKKKSKMRKELFKIKGGKVKLNEKGDYVR